MQSNSVRKILPAADEGPATTSIVTDMRFVSNVACKLNDRTVVKQINLPNSMRHALMNIYISRAEGAELTLMLCLHASVPDMDDFRPPAKS